MLKVSLDGGNSYQKVVGGEVRVIVKAEVPLEEEGAWADGEIHFNINEEGVVTDVWAPDAVNSSGTCNETHDEIVARLTGDDFDD